MSGSEKVDRRLIFRLIAIMALMVAFVGLGLYCQLFLRTDKVYTHFAYIPIVLAGLWWGRKGVWVAALFGVAIFVFRLFGVGIGDLGSDIARVLFYLLVASSVATLTEKVISGRKALSASEEKYRFLIEKSLAGIMVYNDNKIVFVNPRFSEMLDYPPHAIIGKSMPDLIYEQDREQVGQIVRKRETEGVPDLHYECRMVRADGKVIWVDAASSAADYEGKPAVLVNVYDITDRKEGEEKRRELSELARKQEEQLVHSTRLAELGEMAAAVAHELNQPLTGIKNFSKNALFMMENQAGSAEDVKANLHRISEQVDRAAKIIGQMRELTRKSEQQFSLVDINSTLRESIEFLTPHLKLSGVKLDLDLSKDLPKVMGDRIRLEQVFLNLLTNARQAMEESEERRLLVRTYYESGNHYPVVVEIKDTGKGFSEEEAEKLFTPFYSTKQAGHGTGLGLSISLSIIKNHQGAIEAYGLPGKGAKFTVRLPVLQEVS